MAIRPTDPEALHLYQLIGAPLLAVIQAEAQAAQVSADFISHIGFEKAPAAPPEAVAGDEAAGASTTPATATQSRATMLQEGRDLGALRVAEFRIDRVAGDGTLVPHVARVPVLSLFPIPLMQVKHAEFDFDIRVVTRVPLENPRVDPKTEPKAEADKNASNAVRPPPDYLDAERVELKGFLANTRGGGGGQAVTDASIKVRVRMEQSDLPAGLIKLMRMMDESVSVVPQALVDKARAKVKDNEKPAENT